MQKTANCTWCAMPCREQSAPRHTHQGMIARAGFPTQLTGGKRMNTQRTMVKKILIAMKLTVLLIIGFCLQLSASTSAQTITFSGRHIAFKQIFNVIEKQTDYVVFYKKELLKSAKPISIQADNMPLKQFLELSMQNQDFSFEISDKTIILKDKIKTESPATATAGNNTVTFLKDKERSGTVKDKKGNPVPGVSVHIKGTNKGTATDAEGKFTLQASDEDVLIFSFIGYKTLEVAVKDKSSFNISLEENVSGLNEVVVTGYQNINKKLFTGAATTVSGAEVKQDGITDVSRMLEGRVAGVSVQNVSGTFGAAPRIRVRGATSISGENKPLWVIDGVVLEDIVNISNDQLASGDALTLIGSSVAGINADDIESFNILKDASATALYGARAMNGVVVITTKKGRAGRTQVNYNGNFSTFLKPNYNNYNIMNSAEQMSVYAELYRKGSLNATIANGMNGGVYAKMYQLIKTYDETTGQFGVENTPEGRAAFLGRYAKVNTDWFDILFRNSFVQEHSLSISSGSDKSQHYFSVGYYDDNGWTIADRVQRYTMNLRGNYNITDKLSAAILANGAIRQQRAPGTQGRTSNVVEGKYNRDFDINPFSYALNTSRTISAYDESGELEYFTRNYAPFNIINELNENKIDLDMLDLKLQGELNYKINKNLNFKSIGALRVVKTTREHQITEYSNMALAYRYAPNSTIANNNIFLYDDPDHPEIIDPESVLPHGGFYNRNDDYLFNYYIRNQLEWKKEINRKHYLGAFAGQEIKYTNRKNSFNNGYGYQYDKGGVPFTDYRIIKMMLEGNYSYFGMSKQYDRYASFFFNGSYAYDSKYVFNGTIRYDGSNRMGASPTARWLPTWTLSAAWNLDQEDFLKYNNTISYLKLRGSYGLTASIGNATNSAVVLNNGTTNRPRLSEVEPNIEISSLENSELTWEKQYELDLGTDLGLFKDRFNFTFDFYKRNSFDLISSLRTSGIGGEVTKTANYADMVSHGFEVTIGGKPIQGKNFSWRSNLTFGFNKNKITNLKSKPRIYDMIIPEGGPSEGRSVRGLYSINFQELDNRGVPYFINENGELSYNVYVQSTNKDYLVYEGPVDPTITGGFNNTFNYKNFTLNVFVSYQAGNKIRLNNVFSTYYDDTDAMPKEFLDRWTLPLDEKITNVPSIADYLTKSEISGAYPYTAYNYTSNRVADGSFVRLKQASLSYNMPSSVAKLIHANNLSFKVQGNNIWLIYADKKLKGQDPEFFSSGGVALPVPKQITFTLKAGF
ncbi:SusC/RagA family TonB-linked outer membrane protein [Chitinophaga caeni]|nr:SusC/RagA family TonB-linked outer membrane protein [Chitinophaga caeni]